MTTVSPSPTVLQQLVIEIDEARAAVELLRGSAEQQRRRFRAAQARLRRALETYDAVMTSLGLPLPHHLRVELNVYRCLLVESETPRSTRRFYR
jgi:transcription initiation factor TFIIIB Brf1 subunit/transcription initiation factor TFIIB